MWRRRWASRPRRHAALESPQQIAQRPPSGGRGRLVYPEMLRRSTGAWAVRHSSAPRRQAAVATRRHPEFAAPGVAAGGALTTPRTARALALAPRTAALAPPPPPGRAVSERALAVRGRAVPARAAPHTAVLALVAKRTAALMPAAPGGAAPERAPRTAVLALVAPCTAPAVAAPRTPARALAVRGTAPLAVRSTAARPRVVPPSPSRPFGDPFVSETTVENLETSVMSRFRIDWGDMTGFYP